jgi:hypothetical protein
MRDINRNINLKIIYIYIYQLKNNSLVVVALLAKSTPRTMNLTGFNILFP